MKPSHPSHRSIVVSLLAAIMVLALLASAVPALAADGIRVTPEVIGVAGISQHAPDISGDFVVYSLGTRPPSDDELVAVKYLLSDAAPFVVSQDSPKVYRDNFPRILSSGGTLYVVWTRVTLTDPWDQDVMIWQGTYDTGSETFVPTNASFPKTLATGPVTSVSDQSQPSVGLTSVGGVDHVVVAWQDTRDNGYDAPQAYLMDLSADSLYTGLGWVAGGGPQTSGLRVDPTGVWGRGQLAPSVGAGGIFWFDERWSFLDADSGLMDTAVWRADLSSGTTVAGPFWTDSSHANDNGVDGGRGPTVTGDGAVWPRSGPYGAFVSQLFTKSTSGTGHLLTWATRPAAVDAWYDPGSTTTGFAFMGAPFAGAFESDIFAYFPRTGQRIAVCDVHWPAGTDPEATANYYLKYQFDPAIGPAPGGYRVIWADDRDSQLGVDESLADPRLYEAFVPTVSLKAVKSHTLRGTRFSLTAGVAPDFAGEKVKLQKVHPLVSHGTHVWAFPTTYGTVKTLGAGSHASWTVNLIGHGSFYVRAYFYGATKYGVDGAGTSGRLVPHVPNYSNVIKVVY